MRKETALTIDSISKTYQKKTSNENRVLNNLSIKINKGDFVTVIGGNGSGKSTLLNSIAGSTTIDTGKIILSGKDITLLKEEQRAKQIGRVFQDPLMGTAPRMTIAENLSLAYRRGKKRTLRTSSSSKEREYYQSLLKELTLGLENRLDDEMGLLSGGQRQSLTLLMATMNKPDILLLDEHTAALDPKTAETVLKLTNERIREEQLTALMITHNMQDALTYGNRLVMIDKGEIKADLNQQQKNDLTPDSLIELFKHSALADSSLQF